MSVRNEIYLKTQQVARALGVSVSTIKRWVDSGMLEATRTIGKHRLIPHAEAKRFAREQGLRFDEAAIEELGSTVAVGRELNERLVVALRRGRSREAHDLIHSAYARLGAVTLSDEVIRPVMQQIGHDWAAHTIDIYQEHRATRAVKLALLELLRPDPDVDAAEGTLPLAVGATPEDDPYALPGLLCELTLRDLGWDVMNLGVNLPLSSLSRAVLAHRPALVWLSVSHIEDAAFFLHEYASFYETAASSGAAVVLGGHALVPEVRSRIVAASFGDRMTHLAEFARRLRPEAVAPKARNRTDHP